MPAECQTARSLRRAAAGLDPVITALVEMRPASLARACSRLQEVSAVLACAAQQQIAPADKPALDTAARALKRRVNTVTALLAGMRRFCGESLPAEFSGYTAEGEAESLGGELTLVCEV